MRINMLKAIDATRHARCRDAILFEVKNGKGALRWNVQSVADDYYGSRTYYELMLHHVPILQADKPACPTCAGLIAVGYGIENADCSELKGISDRINSPYEGLKDAFKIVKPLLGLLQDGLYVLADCKVFPSDGNGHFFWNVPNELVENPTTACVLTEEYHCVSGIPAFLYPSQGSNRFNPERVAYYKQLLSDMRIFPRAIAYFSDALSSVLLDGHHKAAACALVGADLPCLVIMPCSGISYKRSTANKMVPEAVLFGCIKVDCSVLSKRQVSYAANIYKDRGRKTVQMNNYGIIKRDWEACYSDSYKNYPDVLEFAEEAALALPKVTAELIESCFSEPNEENARILRYAIQYLFRTDKEQALLLALRAARLKLNPKLTLAAFTVLASYKHNAAAEQFFIDHLIDDTDPHSALKKVADSYWEV
ncbi:MAG: hypothetical protein FWF10_06310 [Clostridiales bacterium]|nr:hypothetical protein [Clostridiales bacterium]